MAPDPKEVFTTAEVFRLGAIARSAHLPGLMLPWVMCASFSSELYLKCLVLIEGNNYGKDHDLKDLFGRLTQDSQNEIRNCYEPKRAAQEAVYRASGVPIPRSDFDYVLEVSSKSFVKFRYAYEGINGPVGWAMGPADDCLRERIVKLRPDWRVLLREPMSPPKRGSAL
jgi:hypothetical protein